MVSSASRMGLAWVSLDECMSARPPRAHYDVQSLGLNWVQSFGQIFRGRLSRAWALSLWRLFDGALMTRARLLSLASLRASFCKKKSDIDLRYELGTVWPR